VSERDAATVAISHKVKSRPLKLVFVDFHLIIYYEDITAFKS